MERTSMTHSRPLPQARRISSKVPLRSCALVTCLISADQDTVSFGKGIFKDGSFHPPHTVLISMNATDERSPSPQKSRTPTSALVPPLFDFAPTYILSEILMG
jgi:hypothetical protein